MGGLEMAMHRIGIHCLETSASHTSCRHGTALQEEGLQIVVASVSWPEWFSQPVLSQ